MDALQAQREYDRALWLIASDRNRAFVPAYIKNACDKKKAAVEIGIEPNKASEVAGRILKDTTVQRAIELGMLANRLKAHITPERIMQELAAIAFSNSGDYFTWNRDGVNVVDSGELTMSQMAAVASVKERRTAHGVAVEVKLHDKTSALEKLGREIGMFKTGVVHGVDPDTVPEGGEVQTNFTLRIIRAADGKPIDALSGDSPDEGSPSE